MFIISDKLAKIYIDIYEKLNFDKLFNEKICRISDTPLTYRQANSWDADNLLDHKRKNKNQWRKFSLKEIIFIQIVHELKKFGMKHSQLAQLCDSFFRNTNEPYNSNSKPNKTESDIAITCVLGGIDINICIDDRGNIEYFTPVHVMDILQNPRSIIKINLNDIINNIFQKGHQKPISVILSIQDLIKENINIKNSKKEEELLKLIRDNSYSSVTVKKKDGKIAIAYAEKQNSEGEIGLKELEKLINARDYQNVVLKKRDGKIVNYLIEETFKL